MKESPIFSQTYDLLRWLLPLVGQMPREHRGGLTRRLADVAFAFQHALLCAAKQRDGTGERLREADVLLTELRVLLRLARDLELLSFKQYEQGARRTAEIGRLLGGWLRSTTALSPGREP
jgi:hypothetical protein